MLMVNLTITMRHLQGTVLILLSLFWAWPGSAQAQQTIEITSPASGAMLRGTVSIQGTTDIAAFQSAELSFAFADDADGAWFLLAKSDQPVSNGELGSWDTTTVADGDYTLRLKVFSKDGQVDTSEVTGLQIRNDQSTETALPEPTTTLLPASTQTRPVPSATVPVLAVKTPTALPVNPATVSPEMLEIGALKGAIAAVAGVLFMGLYALVLFIRDHRR